MCSSAVYRGLDRVLIVCGYMLGSAVATPKSICGLRDAANDAPLVVGDQSAVALSHASARASPAVACRPSTFSIRCMHGPRLRCGFGRFTVGSWRRYYQTSMSQKMWCHRQNQLTRNGCSCSKIDCKHATWFCMTVLHRSGYWILCILSYGVQRLRPCRRDPRADLMLLLSKCTCRTKFEQSDFHKYGREETRLPRAPRVSHCSGNSVDLAS